MVVRHGITIILLLFLAATETAAPLCSAGTGGGDYLVLETADPPGDQEDALRPGNPNPKGDLRGARLVLRKVPINRGELTGESRPAYVYVPVELTILVDSELTAGEVQLCIFSHLPPLHIEHIITRDSILLGQPEKESRILLATRSEASLFTGMEASWDAEVIAFQESEHYRNCFFEVDPEARIEGLRRAAEFNIHSGTTYIFPPSPGFYWRDIPPLSVSASLVVRELNGLAAGPVKSLISDTLKSTWKAAGGREVFD